MTTKIRRGRDPEQHVVHNSPEEANAFTGLLGQITLTRNDDGLTELRAHDGRTAGGFVVALAQAGSMQSAIPPRLATPQIAFTIPQGGVFTISHQLGYTPAVQVFAATNGTPVNIGLIWHDDLDNVTLTFSSAFVGSDVIAVLA